MRLVLAVLVGLLTVGWGPVAAQTRFGWPEGKRVGVSFSFDDARASQVVTGLDVLARHGAKVTFYVNPRNMDKQLAGWKRAAAAGHEIGNHSMTHPCSGNFPWARSRAIEEYTAAKFEDELVSANAEIERMLGVKAVSFAYPCGSKFIGRGTGTLSTVPIVARHFQTGRGFRDEAANDAAFCDFAQLLGVESDGMSFEQMKQAALKAAETGAWLVFAGHEIGDGGAQTTRIAALEEFLEYAKDPANGVWVDRVDVIARYVEKARAAAR